MTPQQQQQEEAESPLREPLLSTTAPSHEDGSSHAGDPIDPSPFRDEPHDEEPMAQRAPPPRNVKLVLVYTWVAFTGRGLWNQNCLATLVFLLQNGDPTAVGYLTASMGLAQLCASLPTGILADTLGRRDTMLKVACAVGLLAAGVSIYAALYPGYGILVLALVLWGLHWGIANTSILALFSDSIPDGERSYYFTRRAVLINLANTCGPVLALVMFAFLGNTWTIQDCGRVLLCGNLISLPGLFLLCAMRDDEDGVDGHEHEDELGDRDATTPNTTDLEAPLLPRSSAASSNTALSTTNSLRRRQNLFRRRHSSITVTADTHRDEAYDEDALRETSLARSCCCNRIVPALVATGDVVAGFASGMSIRYLAIFLYDNLNLSPMAVQVCYILTPVLQVVLRQRAQALAGVHGRCQVTVAMKWTGIALMLSMVAAYRLGLPRWVVCGILVLRTGFMNAPSSLTKSLLMDHVPKEERARWASLESVSMVSWSGSAALGGLLVEAEGILANFCVTALLQFLATAPLVVLGRFVVQDEDDEDEAEAGGGPGEAVAEALPSPPATTLSSSRNSSVETFGSSSVVDRDEIADEAFAPLEFDPPGGMERTVSDDWMFGGSSSSSYAENSSSAGTLSGIREEEQEQEEEPEAGDDDDEASSRESAGGGG